MQSTEITACAILLVLMLVVVLYVRVKRRWSRPSTLRHRLLTSGSVNRAW